MYTIESSRDGYQNEGFFSPESQTERYTYTLFDLSTQLDQH